MPANMQQTIQPNRVQLLPFRIGVSSTAQDLAEVISVRSEAYSRHNAPGATRLKVAEEEDAGEDAVLLLARSKLDGGVIGSVRVQTRVVKPLMVESFMTLPAQIARGSPVELMRGSVRSGAAGGMVTAALAKACFLLAKACGFDHLLLGCREPVNLMYRAYQFDELLDGRAIDLHYAPGVKHKILALPVNEAESRWKERNARLLGYMVHTSHPDIVVDYQGISRKLHQLKARSQLVA
jgi:hypothetical protein